MREKLWKIIEQSKQGANFDSRKQYENLFIEMFKHKGIINQLEKEWYSIERELRNNPEYEQLHLSNGGVCNGDDDTFYMDFCSWIVAQGKELFEEFQKEGSKAIMDYIKKNQIQEKDYNYECISYAFYDCKHHDIHSWS